jgi:uncharacterized phage protein gp47/JayE
MAIQSPKSFAVYSSEVLKTLQATGITQTAPGGKARAFADIVASEMSTLEANAFGNLSQALLPYATGTSLDFIGAIYGVTRIPASNSAVSSTDGTLTFYVQSGTFGSINNGNDIIVPAGTLVFSNGNNLVSYATMFQTTLPAASNSQTFTATAVQVGSGGNAPANSIINTNFIGYAQASYGTLLVTNSFGIVSGRDVEDDLSYAYRIQLALKTVGGSSESDLTVQLLTVPGVQNVDFEELPGTFNVFIFTISSSPSDYVIQLAQSVIDNLTAFPIKGTAIAPDLVGISLVTTLKLIPALTEAQSTIIANAISAATNYINNVGINGTIIINEIASILLSSDTNILDIGLPNQPLLQIFIWRSREDGTRYSRNLVQDYTLATGERLVVENITNPINLTVGS